MTSKKEEMTQAVVDRLFEQVKDLTKKLDAKNARISELKAWRTAAVRDNKRVRAENKAFRETQEELIQQVQSAKAEVERLRGCAGSRQDEFLRDWNRNVVGVIHRSAIEPTEPCARFTEKQAESVYALIEVFTSEAKANLIQLLKV